MLTILSLAEESSSKICEQLTILDAVSGVASDVLVDFFCRLWQTSGLRVVGHVVSLHLFMLKCQRIVLKTSTDVPDN